MKFEDIDLHPALLENVRAQGYEVPTPIQAQAIPHVLAGKDLVGCAQTGTGKTAAFALPILHRLMERRPPEGAHRPVRVLVLSPTRELAAQISESFDGYSHNLDIDNVMIFGGVRQNPQVAALRAGVEVVVATPGRLLDLFGQGYIDFDQVEVLVLDEADRMLDMGFIPDIRRILYQLPEERQTLMFSATIPPAIEQLVQTFLKDPEEVSVAPSATTLEEIEQRVYFVERIDKLRLLLHMLEADAEAMARVLVFTRTKAGAERIGKQLKRARLRASAIHGNRSQAERDRALARFKQGEIRVLVATDVASRGLDVDDITHVVNFDVPEEGESYVHRIGRTGRAGNTGIAVLLCCLAERMHLRTIEKLIKKRLIVITDHPYPSAVPPPLPTQLKKKGGWQVVDRRPRLGRRR